MVSFEAIEERLATLQETTAQLKDLIHRLSTITFTPGSVPLTAEDNPATELASEISQILHEEDEELDLVLADIPYLPPSPEELKFPKSSLTSLPVSTDDSPLLHRKKHLVHLTSSLASSLKILRKEYHTALLTSRRALESAQKEERAALLASLVPVANTSDTSSPAQKHTELFSPRDRLRFAARKQNNAQDDVVSASSNVTDALRRTHALIAGEVAKSAFAAQTLAESTAALKELQGNYEGLEGLLAKSRDLVGTLLTSQKSDTWYLRTSFYVLLVTLAWLVFRRWLYGPLWWVLWLPVRTGFRTGKGVVRWAGNGGEPQALAVPTITVGGAERVYGREEEKGEDGGESMVERVARIVEDSVEGKLSEEELNATAEEEDKPNPMKRMWEEDVQGEGLRVGDERARDEL
ncbi:hypothetical protein OQA88_3666 [Cercophora sp. LCS_1]